MGACGHWATQNHSSLDALCKKACFPQDICNRPVAPEHCMLTGFDWCSENIPQPSGIIALMKVHLATLGGIARKRLAETTPSGGQACKNHIQHSAEDHGGEAQPSRPAERKRQRDVRSDPASQIPDHDGQTTLKHISAACGLPPRKPPGAVEHAFSEFRHCSSAQQIEQTTPTLANQRRDVLVDWLRKKAANNLFRASDDAELVMEACTHLSSTILQPKANGYGNPARFHQAITPRTNLWARLQAPRADPDPHVTTHEETADALRDWSAGGCAARRGVSSGGVFAVSVPVRTDGFTRRGRGGVPSPSSC